MFKRHFGVSGRAFNTRYTYIPAMWFSKPKKPSPSDAVREMREAALTSWPSSYATNLQPAEVAVAMMEIGTAGATVSLVCFVDGTTSLYFSSGGGIIGAGEHEPVRAANGAFRKVAEESLPLFVAAPDHAMPSAGEVRFYVYTGSGLLTARASERALAEGTSALAPLFLAGHGVIMTIREATPDA